MSEDHQGVSRKEFEFWRKSSAGRVFFDVMAARKLAALIEHLSDLDHVASSVADIGTEYLVTKARIRDIEEMIDYQYDPIDFGQKKEMEE